jgi:hypothetical protein
LDEYGVWVKSEPRILDSGGAEPPAGLSPAGVRVKSEPRILDSGGAETFAELSLADLDTLPDFLDGADSEDFSLPEADFNFDDFDMAVEGPEGTDTAAEDVLGREDDTLPSIDKADASIDGDTPAEHASGDSEEFTDIALGDLLDVAEEISGDQDLAELEEPAQTGPVSSAGIDMSTQLLMKIAGELASIRQELNALKQEFAISRGGFNADHDESRGFFDAAGDDKIALTGDELNNIIGTADFTGEPGADAAKTNPPDFSGENSPAAPGEFSPEADTTPSADTGFTGEFSLPAEFSPDEIPSGDVPFENFQNESFPEENRQDEKIPDGGDPLFDFSGDLAQNDLPAADEAEEELSLVEEPDEAGDSYADRTDADITAESAAEEQELPGISPDDAENLLSLSPDMITEENIETGGDFDLPDISIDLPVEENPAERESPKGSSIEDFEEDVLDLSGAVIDEPDLGAAIQENPPVEPGPANLENGLVSAEAPLEILEELPESLEEPLESLEEPFESLEEPPELLEELPESLEEPLEILEEPLESLEEPLEILEEPLESLEEPLEILKEPPEPLEEPLEPLEESLESTEYPAITGEEPEVPALIEDAGEISLTEESAGETPAARTVDSRGEDLEQIIPEGFLVKELDDETETDFGGAGLDTLDEIPEDMLREENKGAAVKAAAEPELPGVSGNFKKELMQVLSYMDQLLESLPDEKIEEFAQSAYFDTYKKLFKDLGLA